MPFSAGFRLAASLSACVFFTCSADAAEAAGTGFSVSGDDRGISSRLSEFHALSSEGEHAEAALVCRRNAAESTNGLEVSSWLLNAADMYRKDRSWARMGKMLDEAEAADADLQNGIAETWLRAEHAAGVGDWTGAAFYFESLRRKAGACPLGDYATLSAASAHLREGDEERANAVLVENPVVGKSSGEKAPPIETVRKYSNAPMKKPWLGGVLGVVPGLGYAYSGEYGNATRSLLLNGLFGWGMVATAERDQWALFGITAFFEGTWYSGSIYGGIDAAERHNKKLLDDACDAIGADSLKPSLTPGFVPAAAVRISF